MNHLPGVLVSELLVQVIHDMMLFGGGDESGVAVLLVQNYRPLTKALKE